jgi:hypothetical protein
MNPALPAATLTRQELLAFAATLILACCASASAQTTPRNPTPTQAVNTDDLTSGEINGSVMNESGQPMAGVPLFIRPVNSASSGRSSTTDAEGNFHITGLTPALYVITGAAPAYVAADADANLTPRYYRLGDTVRIDLVRGGVITGTVTNAAGEPVINVPVRASMIRDAKGQPSDMTALYFMDRSTDDRGVYRIFGLTPGTYVVSAGGGRVLRFQLSPYDSDVLSYAPSSTREGASEITVRAGDETTVDIRYRGDKGHSISGSVKLSGTSTGDSSISLASVAGGVLPISNAFQVPGSNGFSFPGLADGEYILVAQEIAATNGVTTAQLPNFSFSEPRHVIVKGADVTGVELVPRSLSSINGRVALEPSKVAACQGKRRPLFSEMIVKVERPEKDREQETVPVLRLISGSASPDAKGNFTMRNLLPARYLPQLSFYARYWYLDSISIAATPKFDAAANWTTLKSGERPELTITLAEGAASIRGRVDQASAGLGVYLLPADRERSADVLRYFVTTVAADGTFSFNNLPPGKYVVLPRALDADTSTNMKLRLPESAEARTKLRHAAETQKTNLELKPCQNLVEYELKQSAP